jgi:hypothetical protein
MELWQMDNVGGVKLKGGGVKLKGGGEAKIVSGIDDNCCQYSENRKNGHDVLGARFIRYSIQLSQPRTNRRGVARRFLC